MLQQNNKTMLAARFSDNIQADITRNWSAWMLPNLAGSYDENIQDAIEHLGMSEEAAGNIVREFPEYPGCFGCVHHQGLSSYVLKSDNVEDAVAEVKGSALDGRGYGVRTIGAIKLLKTISKEELGSVRDLHIVEIEDYETEGF